MSETSPARAAYDLGGRRTDREAGGRITGLDLARFAAITGMVVVHGGELGVPSLQASLGADVAPADAPRVLEWMLAAATNRARLLFFLLAGVSLALLSGRGRAGTGVLLRRAGFLTGSGVLLALLGWGDLVLVFYGVLFVVAPLLLRLPTPVLLATAVVSVVPAVLLVAQDPGREAGATGAALLLGEITSLFALGLAVGRLPLLAAPTARRLALLGAALSAPGLVVLASTGGLDVTEVTGALELVSALTSGAGLALLALAACLELGRSTTAARRLQPLAALGGMPLTAYVGHALLFPVIDRTTALTPAQGTATAAGYLVAATVFAVLWRRHHGSGPVERAMRRTTRT